MPRWARGEAEVEQLVARGELERVAGAAAGGTSLLEQATRRPRRPGLSPVTRTALTSWPMTLRGSPASPRSRSRACALRPVAVTTRSNRRSGLSSGTDSGRSGLSGGAATSWNTRTCRQIQPRRRKPNRQQGQRRGLSPPQASCCPNCPSSAKIGSYGTGPPQETAAIADGPGQLPVCDYRGRRVSCCL